MDSTRSPRLGTDVARQVSVIASYVACLVGTLYGTGVLGTRVEESTGGRLSAEATLVAPAGPAFSIWSVIYLGLGAFTVWHTLPSRAADPRARATGWLAAASMLLNAGWLWVTQVGWLDASVLVIVMLLAVLAVLMVRLVDLPDGDDRFGRVAVDGTFGLYLGWVCVAVCANITAALVARGAPATGTLAEAAAVVVLVVVAFVGILLARRTRGRLTVAAAMAWGLGWLAWGRAAGEPQAPVVAGAAVVAAVVILVAHQRSRASSTASIAL